MSAAYTDADVQAALNAYFNLPADYAWPDMASSVNQGMRDALDAVAPAIVARAKAEALREAACNLPTLTIHGLTVADVLNEWASDLEHTP